MTASSLPQLKELAQSLGLELTPERLEAVLPEVQRLWAQAARLRAVEVTSDQPATRFLAP